MIYFSYSFLTFFFFNDTETTEIYTLSLHDALPISPRASVPRPACATAGTIAARSSARSEEHTSELQSRDNIVCRLLLEKKKHKLIKLICFYKKIIRLNTLKSKRSD